jgi:hypothetical protein
MPSHHAEAVCGFSPDFDLLQRMAIRKHVMKHGTSTGIAPAEVGLTGMNLPMQLIL